MDDEATTTSTSLPGFGAIVALVALVATALLAVRRR
jgi:PGF-CTERM protein